VKAAGGGSTDWRTASPTSYDRPGNSTSVLVPLLVLLAILFLPAFVLGRRRPDRS